jgi:hypothetical protein
MVTAIADAAQNAAKVERPEGAADAARTEIKTEMPLASNPAILPKIPLTPGNGLDAQDFARANRIHIKDGSLFIDPYLVIHPRELAPENEEQLKKKLELTYSITNPSFFEAPERAAIALNLGQLVPVSLAAKRSQLMDQVKQFNSQVDNGSDAALVQQATDKREPFAAIVRDTIDNPNVDPAGLELLKNGLGIYMLIREKLTKNGYFNRLSDYVTRMNNPDQILGDLQDNIGVSPQMVREAALKGGVDGVGKLLGIDAKYIADVKELTAYAATQDFGYNLVEHWYLGRQQNENLPLKEKIALGLQTRIPAKIHEYRAKVRGHYDVPEPVKKEQERIADALNLVTPIQRKLLYALGYEICYTPEMTADDIAFHRGIYGLHRKAANDLRDIRGTYRIFFSGKGDLEGSMRTLCHEIAHNFWPEQFSPQQVAQIDKLANDDKERFDTLNYILRDPQQFDHFSKLFAAYKAGDAQEKEAVIKSANAMFADLQITVDNLFPHLTDPYELRHLVAYAQDTLQVEGSRYNKSGYDSPQERFREVVSRFAELKQVRLRGKPELLQFIAPGLNEIWDKHYIPHLEKVYAEVVKSEVTHVQPAAPLAPEPVAPAAPQPTPTPVTEPYAPVQHPEPNAQHLPDNSSANACIADLAVPSNNVQAPAMHLKGIESALTALDQMGVRHAL